MASFGLDSGDFMLRDYATNIKILHVYHKEKFPEFEHKEMSDHDHGC
jgi:hypothetical protein